LSVHEVQVYAQILALYFITLPSLCSENKFTFYSPTVTVNRGIMFGQQTSFESMQWQWWFPGES